MLCFFFIFIYFCVSSGCLLQVFGFTVLLFIQSIQFVSLSLTYRGAVYDKGGGGKNITVLYSRITYCRYSKKNKRIKK